MYGCIKDSLILILFRLPQISCFTEGRSSLTNTLAFPPSFFILLSFAWFYIFFSTGRVLLSTVRWCSACASEGVFLMYPWREMYSMSTYSSTIFFSFCISSLMIHLPRSERWVIAKVLGNGRMDRQNTRVFLGQWNHFVCHYKCLYMYHYTFVKIHKMHNAKSALI